MKHIKNTRCRQLGSTAFTLAELIVVISILAILGTIALVSFSGYIASTRDSNKVADIALISKALDIHRVQTGNLPAPTNGSGVSFSGGTVWTQGSVGDSVVRVLKTLSKKPMDQNFQSEYAYSVTTTGQEYQLGAVLEKPISFSPIFIPRVFAANPSSNLTAYINGTYDSLFVVSKNGSSCVTLSTPSIILAAIPSSSKLEDTSSGSLVYGGKGNLPSTYAASITDTSLTGSFFYKDFKTDTSVVVYNGCTLPDSLTGALTFASNIKKSYKNTQFENIGSVKNISETVDASSLTSVGVGLVNNNLQRKGIGGSRIAYNGTMMVSPSFNCASTPSILHSTNFTIGNPTDLNQSWVYSDTPGNCTFACEPNYVWDINTTSCIQDLCQGDLSVLNGVQKSGTIQSIGQSWMYDNVDTDITCRYTCAIGHSYNASAAKCEPNNCSATTVQVNGHPYNVPSLNHSQTGSTTSSSVSIIGGSITYAQTFSCSLGNISSIGSETANTPSCNTNYSISGSACIPATQTATCSGKPTNSIWNTASSITQTWNGSAWTPTPSITYNVTPSTTNCRYICNTGFHTEDAGVSCISNTRSCTITNGAGSQTWNGSSWGICTVSSCNAGYVNQSNVCIADVCGGTVPAYATSNATSQTIAQNWTFNATAGICTFKCNTNYTWNGTSCVANTQTYTCPVTKPANSSWNTVSNYTQTWNGSAWLPANSSTIYNTAAAATSCRYICSTGFHTEDAGVSCISDARSCTIANGAGSQTWNTGTSVWNTCTVTSCNAGYTNQSNTCVPSNCIASAPTVNTHPYSVGAFNHTTTITASSIISIANGSITYSQSFACNFGSVTTNGSEISSPSCNANYTWNGTSCVANTQTYTCAAKPATGTAWNSVASYTQTWNGSSWSPANTSTVYNATTSTTTCNYTCAVNYTWNGTSCVANVRSVACGGTIVAYAIANTATVYNQTWNGSIWTPTTNWAYGAGSCGYTCAAGYHTENSGASCVPNTRSCAITYGVGAQTWNGSSWGVCTVVSCDAGYVPL